MLRWLAGAWILGTMIVISFRPVIAVYIKENVVNYFNHETTKQFKNVSGEQYKKAQETFSVDLQGHFIMLSLPKLADALYIDDENAKILLKNLRIREAPKIDHVFTYLHIGNNLVYTGLTLSRTVIEGSYVLFRNSSCRRTLPLKKLGKFKKKHQGGSPFAHEETNNAGNIAIVADNCSIAGRSIPILSGSVVSLGHKTFNFEDCQFVIELSQPGSQGPPVMAPYYPPKQGPTLQHLLMKTIINDLEEALQTAAIDLKPRVLFGDHFITYRLHQEKILKHTSEYWRRLVRSLNQIAAEEGQGQMNLKDLAILWNEGCEKTVTSKILLQNIVLHGLDTLYTPSQGGPFHWEDIYMLDQIRFGSLKITGKLSFESLSQSSCDFDMDIEDAAIDVQLYLAQKEADIPSYERRQKYNVQQFEFAGWRNIEYSTLNSDQQELGTSFEKSLYHDVISGYMESAVPDALLQHLHKIFKKADYLTDEQKLKDGDEKEITPGVNEGAKTEIATSCEDNNIDNSNDNDISNEVTKDEEGATTASELLSTEIGDPDLNSTETLKFEQSEIWTLH